MELCAPKLFANMYGLLLSVHLTVPIAHGRDKKGGLDMSLRATVVTLALMLGVSIPSEAQWVPIMAKKKVLSYVLQLDGTWTLAGEKREAYYRSSSGSTLERRYPIVNGKKEGEGEGLFTDQTTGKIYMLKHDGKKAVLLQTLPLPLLPRHESFTPDPSWYVGKQTINGLECIGTKIKGANGVSWYSRDLDLTVKTDFTGQSEGGRVVSELYDIQVGVEPDPSLFAIPKDFTVLIQQDQHQ
jgi:hypothetical protein